MSNFKRPMVDKMIFASYRQTFLTLYEDSTSFSESKIGPKLRDMFRNDFVIRLLVKAMDGPARLNGMCIFY